MPKLNKQGFALIEACIYMLCILLAASITTAAIQGYAHVEHIKKAMDEEEELKEIYAS